MFEPALLFQPQVSHILRELIFHVVLRIAEDLVHVLLSLHVQAADRLLDLASKLLPHRQELSLPVLHCYIELLLSDVKLLLGLKVEEHLVDLELLLLCHH